MVVPEPGAGIGSQRVASRRGYRYDRAGRLENIEDARWGTTNYRYDAAGRLLESRQQLLQETFEHDAADSIVGWVTQLGADGSGEESDKRRQDGG